MSPFYCPLSPLMDLFCLLCPSLSMSLNRPLLFFAYLAPSCQRLLSRIGCKVAQKGPKWPKLVEVPAVHHLGPFWTPLEPFQAKIDFSLRSTSTEEHFVFSGQKINFCLKRSKWAPANIIPSHHHHHHENVCGNQGSGRSSGGLWSGRPCVIQHHFCHHHHHQSQSLRPARPRLDRWARIQFCGVRNQQNHGNQPKTMK